VRGERANVQFNLKELAEKQVQRKLDMRALRVEEQLEQYRESYVRSMVEWNVQVRCHTDLPPRSDTWQDGFVSFCWIVQCSAVRLSIDE
jgi:hypothetical protein